LAEAKLAVKLIDHTEQPFETLIIAARRCYSGKSNTEIELDVWSSLPYKCAELRDYLRSIIDSGHTSILEHVTFTFAVEGVSRALLAQITRHRIASFSVQSQRYVNFDNGFDYIVPDEIACDEKLCEMFHEDMKRLAERYAEYRKAGIKAEDARMILPMAAETKFIMTMNARELLHFFALRCCERAQLEIRELAYAMLDEVNKVLPEVFEKAGPTCVQTGRCPEGSRGCGKCAA
jgi:thymidylate synthase (FAD)